MWFGPSMNYQSCQIWQSGTKGFIDSILFITLASHNSEVANFLVARKKCEELRKEIEDPAKSPDIPEINVPSEILTKSLEIEEEKSEQKPEEKEIIEIREQPVAAKRSSISRQGAVQADPR